MGNVVLKVEVIRRSMSGELKLIRETMRNDSSGEVFYYYTLECPLGSFMAGKDEAVALEVFEDNYKVFGS